MCANPRPGSVGTAAGASGSVGVVVGRGGTAGAVDTELVVGREQAGEESVFARCRAGKVRSVSVLCRGSGISWEGLFDFGLDWDVAEVIERCTVWGA